MRYTALLLSTLLLTSCAGTATNEKTAHMDDHVHIHAGAIVYNDNVQQDYSTPENMYFSPCGIATEDQVRLEDKVHLHDGIGDVVHVHASGVTWSDFLETRGIINPENPRIVYVDGNEGSLTDEIQDHQSALILLGESTLDDTKQSFISDERITEIAKSKENCGSE